MKTFHLIEWFTGTLLLVLSFTACEKEKPPLVVDPASARTTAQGTLVGAVGQYGSHARLPTQKDKCSVLGDLTRWARGVTSTEYAARCSDYPIDKYPWS